MVNMVLLAQGEGLVCACVQMQPRGLPYAEMSKRSVSSREIAGPSRAKTLEDFAIDVSICTNTKHLLIMELRGSLAVCVN